MQWRESSEHKSPGRFTTQPAKPEGCVTQARAFADLLAIRALILDHFGFPAD